MTKAYQTSAKNLNPTTVQIDIDIYHPDGNRVDISGMKKDIKITIKRQKSKNPEAITFSDEHRPIVSVKSRIDALTKREKLPMIYHYFNASIIDPSLNIMIKVDNISSSRIVIVARHKKLPTLDQCDFVSPVRKIENMQGNVCKFTFNFLSIYDAKLLFSGAFADWYLSSRIMNNRTGKWYLGVLAVKDESKLAEIEMKSNCEGGLLAKTDLDTEFGTVEYILQTFTAGCYYLNNEKDTWEAIGLQVCHERIFKS